MSGFLAVAERRLVQRACAEVSAQLAYTKRRNALWVPDDILGVWVGNLPTLNLEFVASFGYLDRWMMVLLDDPTLVRIDLLEHLVGESEDRTFPAEPRFMPVFSTATTESVRSDELSGMRSLHPQEIGAPLLMNPMTGFLSPV